MKNPLRNRLSLSLSLSLSFLTIAPAAALTLVEDDFGDESIDLAKWVPAEAVSARAPNGTLTETIDGQLQFDSRPHLHTVSVIDPDAYGGGISITGQIELGTDDDVFKIVTRSDQGYSNNWGETTNGIEFVITVNGAASTLGIAGRGAITVGTFTSGTAIDFAAGDVLDFEVIDNGNLGLSFSVTRQVDSATSTSTAVLTSDPTTYDPAVTFYNREDWKSATARTTFLNEVNISSIEGTTLGDVTAATLTAGATTFIVGAPDVPLVAEGTFTNAGTINVTTLGSSIVTYSSTDTDVASVSASGLVTLGEPGTADITATVFGDNSTMVTTASVTFDVEVPTNFNFTPYDEVNPNYLLAYGSPEDLTVTADSASLSNVAIEGYTGFSYTSGDPSFVDVDYDSGLLTPYDVGTTTITAELLIPGQAAYSENITTTSEDASTITATIDSDTLFIGGFGATVTLEVTTPNITTPIVINNVEGVAFFTDGGSDIYVDGVTGAVTPGTDTNALGDSIITGEWYLADGSTTISDTVTVTLTTPSPKPATLLHCYDFTGPAGDAAPENTVISDSVGTADGVVLGAGAVFSADGGALVLPGGAQATGAYVDLPDYLISGITDVDTVGVSFELWLTKNVATAWARALDFGDSAEPVNFVNIIAQRGGGGGVIASEFTLDRTTFGGQFTGASSAMTVGERSHLVVTIDPETSAREIYLNGVPVGSSYLALDNRSIASLNDVNNWLGRSNGLPSDPLLAGTYDTFCLYSGIMTPEEVAANYTAGAGVDFDSWATDNGIDGELPGDDFEKDGLSNFLEYALGKNPTLSDAPAGTFDGSSVSFTKGAEAITSGDVQWVIEESDDLGATDPWEAVVTHLGGDATPTISYTLPGGKTKVFVRLIATEVAP